MNPFSVEHLTLHYEKTPCLWDVSLSVEKGSLVGIIGPNGAGKSSFLKASLGLVKPSCGKALFWNKPFSQMAKKVAYIPQKEEIDWSFPITVLEVALMARYHKMGFWKRPRKADFLAVEEALEKVGMYPFRNRQIKELSGGQQKRVFLARALVQEAELYFLDEPFQGVDIETEKTLVCLLKKLAKKGKTILMVHHDLHNASSYFDQLILLNTSLVAFGPSEEVLTKQYLSKLYSKNHELFEELFALSSKKMQGRV